MRKTKEENTNKGITLIALVITIIVMLILVAVTISMAINGGLFEYAGKSTIKTEIAKIEEEGNIIYWSLTADKYIGNTQTEVTLTNIVGELKAKGYEIVQVENSENAITGITLDKLKINTSAETTETIKVIYEENPDEIAYYAVVNGSNYKMMLTENGVKIERTPSEINGNPVTAMLEATSSEENNVTIEKIEGNIIKIKTGDTNGNSTITVTYGSYSKTCEVKIIARPTEGSDPDATTTFSTSSGKVDIIWLSGTTNKVTTNPNAPILTSNEESLIPVKWDSSNDIVETTASDPEWYSYTAGTGTADNTASKWANAKTANNSFFVWIPRYAYRITYYDGTGTTPTGYYDGYGMWNATDGTIKYALESGIETVDYNGEKYIVHPAFEDDLELGGWSEPLTGFWFAKFEMGGSTTDLNSTYGSTSLIAQSIGTYYTIARQSTYGYTGTIDSEDGKISFMNSHMVKNSEWGAVAFLTHSTYGRNGTEVSINGNSSFIRGGGIGVSYLTNTNQSTTGNVYGIYDMSGGASEYVAGYDNKGNATYINNGSSFASVNGTSTKYATAYTNGSSTYTGIQVYTIGKTGDATKEVYLGDGGSKRVVL